MECKTRQLLARYPNFFGSSDGFESEHQALIKSESERALLDDDGSMVRSCFVSTIDRAKLHYIVHINTPASRITNCLWR